jgi:replication factor C small subunit
MSSIINELFTEKFRPKKLEHLIAPSRVKDELSKGLIQNLLLFGSPGTGKTSTLWILANGHPTLYINCSSERGIDTIREKITSFCSTMSLDSGYENLKCVILDELDGATDEFFKALRAVMERFAKNVRFIASCNYFQKIPEPIWKSRFHPVSYDPIDNDEEVYLKDEYKKRIAAILKSANVGYTDEILDKFIHNDFPDLRALMNKIQSLFLRGVKELTTENISTTSDFSDLFKLCISSTSKPYDNYKAIINQYGTRVDDALASLGNDFPEYLKNTMPSKLDKLPSVLIAVADYQYQKSFVIDPLITLLAAVFRIQQIINQ